MHRFGEVHHVCGVLVQVRQFDAPLEVGKVRPRFAVRELEVARHDDQVGVCHSSSRRKLEQVAEHGCDKVGNDGVPHASS